MMKNRILIGLWGMLMCLVVCAFDLTGQAIDSMLNLGVIVSIESASTVNSKNLESSPVYYENGIVFVYAKEKAKLIDSKIGMPYFELMYSDLGPDGQPRKAVSFSPNIRSRFHEGPTSFTSDFQKMYFTRSNFKNGKGIADAEKKIRLKIFSAKKGLQDWEDIVEMPFCADEYSTCHPAISADGQLMVFASDMPGGFGGMDLYLTEKVNEIWQTPKNLGPEINTDKNEIFPNLHVNGVLFFSSNGHKGRGGLDVFATHLDGTSANGLIHMPSPFNSREDDLGLVIDQSGLSGFIASARKGKKYKDDIFLLNMSENIFKHQEPEPEIIVIAEKNEELNPEMNDSLLIKDFKPLRCLEVKSRIRDKNSLKPISGATMYFTNDCGDQIHQVEADGNGYTIVCLKPLCNYTVEVTNKGYQLHTYKFFPDPEIHSTWNIFLEAEPEEVLIAAGATIILDNIYYDFNKSAIQKGAATELKELARIMKLYPSMKIQLAAHTDSRGTDSYNLELSERRAFAAKDFLVARGVPSKRISTIAKGESEIRNACSDGVPCTELQHRYNRRTEVNVLSIDEPVQIQYKNGEIN